MNFLVIKKISQVNFFSYKDTIEKISRKKNFLFIWLNFLLSLGIFSSETKTLVFLTKRYRAFGSWTSSFNQSDWEFWKFFKFKFCLKVEFGTPSFKGFFSILKLFVSNYSKLNFHNSSSLSWNFVSKSARKFVSSLRLKPLFPKRKKKSNNQTSLLIILRTEFTWKNFAFS